MGASQDWAVAQGGLGSPCFFREGRCDRRGPVAGDEAMNVTLGKDGVERWREAPCSPLPGLCKLLKALLGCLLENGVGTSSRP